MDTNNNALPSWFQTLQDNAKNSLVPIFEEIINADERSIDFKYKTVQFSIYREKTADVLRCMHKIPDNCFFTDGEYCYKLSEPVFDNEHEMVSAAYGVKVSSYWAKVRGIIPWTDRDIFCKKTHSELSNLLSAEYSPEPEQK